MRCIFCKAPSDRSRSREHIIPESLGNTKHVLLPGAVCDGCNHYFAIKVEKPVLDSEYFTSVRFINAIPNKKGRIPILEIVGPNGEPLEMYRTTSGLQGIVPLDKASERSFMAHLTSHKQTVVRSAGRRLADMNLIARFLAKSAIEVLAYRIGGIDGWQDQIVDKQELDSIRTYARYGRGSAWPFYQRRIYPEHFQRFRPDGSSFETMHEFDLLHTEECELFAVICILGVELTVNLGDRDVSGYACWLERNAFASPLYPDRSPTDHL